VVPCGSYCVHRGSKTSSRVLVLVDVKLGNPSVSFRNAARNTRKTGTRVFVLCSSEFGVVLKMADHPLLGFQKLWTDKKKRNLNSTVMFQYINDQLEAH
jgi:hypothetical protein